MPESILVTGASGQVGGFTVGELINMGYRVIALDVRFSDELIRLRGPSLELVNADLSDFDELISIIKRFNVRRIIHLAAMILLESRNRPLKAAKVNIIGTLNVFEAARLMDLERVVYASSESVYGSPLVYGKGSVNEDDYPHTPPDPYHITKLADELFGSYYSEAYGLSVIGGRLTTAWGPGRYSGYTGQFNSFLRDVIIKGYGKVPPDFAYSGAKYRWLYVKDAARAFIHLALVDKAKVRRPVYNTGSMKPFTVIDVINTIKELIPNARIDYEPLSKPTETSSRVPGPAGLDVDCSRLYDELGFSERYGLKGGLIDMIEYEKSRAK
ncbi:NAD-dependent epimerase/dehydratase family protein [Caldivirga maquilingensis]|uniref:NAD-dependent epimerase/dehydratase n=1 Tax=Caldivirga maquilingensis (strain ATCC 700844 / DSM 13496 / JCM 10307 / IC-167) TaxID=397948 RepID=A8MD47_CALMQ|nr:NAD(P)-dependent oxidoreductase [Caldivirga maquilingensis]ABW01703.1 NAD-dependent epimerase/dehydratase [Caldivirga maquilingensis IC-167]